MCHFFSVGWQSVLTVYGRQKIVLIFGNVHRSLADFTCNSLPSFFSFLIKHLTVVSVINFRLIRLSVCHLNLSPIGEPIGKPFRFFYIFVPVHSLPSFLTLVHIRFSNINFLLANLIVLSYTLSVFASIFPFTLYIYRSVRVSPTYIISKHTIPMFMLTLIEFGKIDKCLHS